MWRVDEIELTEACYFMGIEYPVIVIPADGFTGKYHGIGYYGPAARGKRLAVPTHQFSISADTTAHSANRVAWHELAHVAQTEAFMPEADEDGLPRHVIGMRKFTEAYAKESREVGGYSYGTNYPGASYTKISFEQDATDRMRYADQVRFLVPVDSVESDEPERAEWKRYRVDILPSLYIINKRYTAATYYVNGASERDVERYIIDKYRVDKWDIHMYLCPPLEPDRVA